MNPNFSERVLAQIEEEEVRPVPRWVFQVRAAAFWALWAVTTLAGALVVSVALFRLVFSGWAFRLATHDSTARFLVQTVPVVWFLLFAGVVAAAYVLFRRTDHGYRHPFYWAVGSSLVLSVLLGGALHAQGAGKVADEFVERAMPFYVSVEHQQQRAWVNPPRGLLAGKVISTDQALIYVQDFGGDDWEVDGGALSARELSAARPGIRVRVLGIPGNVENHTMQACLLLPWDDDALPLGMMGERNGMGMRSNPCKGLRPYEALQPLLVP